MDHFFLPYIPSLGQYFYTAHTHALLFSGNARNKTTQTKVA